MFARSLGDDGAELRPLEPWQAGEFLAHMDRGREHIGRYIGLPDVVEDLESSRAYLKSYAEKAATDTGRIYGIWADGELVGGVLFRTMDVEQGTAEAGCWLEPSAVGRGLVTRAVRVIIDWAVEERGIHRDRVDRLGCQRAQHRGGPAAGDDQGRRAAREPPVPGRAVRQGGLVGAGSRVAVRQGYLSASYAERQIFAAPGPTAP